MRSHMTVIREPHCLLQTEQVKTLIGGVGVWDQNWLHVSSGDSVDQEQGTLLSLVEEEQSLLWSGRVILHKNSSVLSGPAHCRNMC